MTVYYDDGLVTILHGDCRAILPTLEAESVQTCVTSPPYFGLLSPYFGIIQGMKDNNGKFKKGEHRSPATEFKPGTHWRKPQPFREKEWLEQEYVTKQRSTGEIAAEFGVTDAAILYWLNRHGIPRRPIAKARSVKHWGAKGAANGMHGRAGQHNPNWKGGISPERAAFYSSQEWAAVVPLVWKRDKATCQRCKQKQNGGPTFHIHHIVSFQVVELRAALANLVLLCKECHDWVHSSANVNREFIKDTP